MSTDEAGALRALSDAHATALWRYVVQLTGDRAGADDIVQETLLRAWRTPAIIGQKPESTRSWPRPSSNATSSTAGSSDWT